MPIINGQKMACAPCIRGHRSTKCNHFYERVMVPVRKPGRPLSTCPCPPGRPCSCGGVRVAIPKHQKCGCPTGSEETEEHEKEHFPSEAPLSPSKPSFRAGKSNGVSKASSRKQSFDPANLERMDPRSINLITATNGNGIPNGAINGHGNGIPLATSPILQASHSDLAGFGSSIRVVPAGPSSAFASPNPNFVSPMPYNMGFQYGQPGPPPHGIKLEDGLYPAPNGGFAAAIPATSFLNGNQTAHVLGNGGQTAISIPKANGNSTNGGSCCGGKAPKPAPAATSPPPPALVPHGVPVSQPGYVHQFPPQPRTTSPVVNSCCANKAQPPAPPANTDATPLPVYNQPYMPQFQYQTVFRYPGDYGSWQHPIDPVIWQQVASQTNAPVHPPMSPTTNGDKKADDGPSHQCHCGEGCQCVGCLAHPFNAQMFQYVNNAYNGSTGNSPTGAEHAKGAPQGPTVATGQDSPAEAPTPATSEGSPGREEQSLSTMDYFFVNLPISGLCEGQLESCPCGDSCDCPGCLVHSIPLNQG
ncbi:uncharacterized protein C8A04DRAFT_27013 [Dichotomopilus funicola]|uniref:Copper-fist domain-containing protein n=1 Tax=Dichotomopilus funicola TaxID=1934379 RepID=A0AAN6ZNQ9_9PEZI|nr:hypothetical protein C8A04DRAFT_27013 [Dichotomopilus funicola]